MEGDILCYDALYQGLACTKLINHIKIHKFDNDFNCSNSIEAYDCDCGYRTFFTLNMRKHIDLVHNQGLALEQFEDFVTYSCKVCLFETFSCFSFHKHLIKNNCVQCDPARRIFSDRNKNGYPQSSIKWHKCDECGYKAKWHFSLKTYISRKHKFTNADVRRFTCDQCAYKPKYFSRSRRRIIIRRITEENWFECHICKFRTKFKTALAGHHSRKHMKDVEWFKCESCGYKAMSRDSLRKHYTRKHPVNLFYCDRCDFSTNFEGFLRKHVMLKHYDWLKCDHCEFKTIINSTLKRHILLKHTEGESIDRFGCNSCVCRSNLQHLKKKISRSGADGEKSGWVGCASCEFKAKLKRNWKEHLIIKDNQMNL